MLITLVYSGIVAYSAQRTINDYIATKAPTSLKSTRNFLNLTILAHYIFLGVFTIYTLGEQELFNLFLGNDEATFKAIQNLPLLFVSSFMAIEVLKHSYRLWKTLVIKGDAPFKIKEVTIILINLGLMTALSLSALSIISPLLFSSLLQGKLAFYFWSVVINEAYQAYEKGQLNKIIDWQFVLANIYLNLTTAVLLTLMTLQVITLGGVLFDSILCFKAAAYLFASSLIDFYNNKEITSKILVKLGVALLQVTFGVLLLSNILIIPEGALFGFLLLSVVKNLSLIPAIDSISREARQTTAIDETYKQLIERTINLQEMNSDTYISYCYETKIKAKNTVLPGNCNHSFFYNREETTGQPSQEELSFNFPPVI